MLKAVRFDEDKHQHLLNYINDYKDSKGRKNESEAIRFLMQKGFDCLIDKSITVDNTKIVSQPQSQEINVERLKNELLNEILGQINIQAFSNLNTIAEKLVNVQPTNVSNKIVEQSEVKLTTVKSKPIDIPTTTNPLLANLLANAQK